MFGAGRFGASMFCPLMAMGRFLAGVSSGLVCVGLRVFLSECSPDEHRGSVNSLAGVVMFLGVISATVSGLPGFLGSRQNFGFLTGLCVVTAGLGKTFIPKFSSSL